MTSQIAQRAMIVSVSISQWSGRKLDREASDGVSVSTGSQSGRARVNKLLIRKEALLPAQQQAGVIRRYVYDNTVPWGDNGDRALLAAHYLTFTQGLGDLIAEFDRRVEDLVREYDAEVERARFELNALFRESDYPDVEQVRRAFRVETSVRPMADSSHMILDALEPEVLDEVREKVEADLRSTELDAMKGVWQSVIEQVEAVRDRMTEDKPRFKRSLVDNLTDLTDRLALLNVAGDPELDRLQAEMQRSLTNFDAEDLRKSGEARKEFVSEADRILGSFR